MPNLTKISPALRPGMGPNSAPSLISLAFDTGESFEIASIDLRFACPCASCVDEMTGKRTLKRESIKPDIKIMKVEPVGRYGIHVEWSDGHRTGMYHFDNLYQLALNKSPTV